MPKEGSIVEYMANAQEQYDVRSFAKDYDKEGVELHVDGLLADEAVGGGAPPRHFEYVHSNDDVDEACYDSDDYDLNGDRQPDFEAVLGVDFLDAVVIAISNMRYSGCSVARVMYNHAARRAYALLPVVNAKDYQEYVNAMDHTEGHLPAPVDPQTPAVGLMSRNTMVHKIVVATQNIAWRDPASHARPDLGAKPTLRDVALHCTLNKKQHEMFVLVGCALLSSYRDDLAIVPLERADQTDQVLAFMSGAAGTGKSAVIRALLLLAAKWDRPASVRTTAFMGIAAVNCMGRTHHNLYVVGMRVVPDSPPGFN
jgi:hypothetical protein